MDTSNTPSEKINFESHEDNVRYSVRASVPNLFVGSGSTLSMKPKSAHGMLYSRKLKKNGISPYKDPSTAE